MLLYMAYIIFTIFSKYNFGVDCCMLYPTPKSLLIVVAQSFKAHHAKFPFIIRNNCGKLAMRMTTSELVYPTVYIEEYIRICAPLCIKHWCRSFAAPSHGKFIYCIQLYSHIYMPYKLYIYPCVIPSDLILHIENIF